MSFIRRDPKLVSVDRLDNAKGYALDNIVLCCKWANLGRNTATVDVWTAVLKELNLK